MYIWDSTAAETEIGQIRRDWDASITDHKEDMAMAYTRSEVPELESMMKSGKKKFVR